MLKRRQTHPLLTLLIALLLPIFSLGCVAVGSSAIVMGSLVPVPTSTSGQPQEEEVPSHAKVPEGSLAKRRREPLPVDRTSGAEVILSQESHEQPEELAPRASFVRLPDTSQLCGPLTRRGPPAA